MVSSEYQRLKRGQRVRIKLLNGERSTKLIMGTIIELAAETQIGDWYYVLIDHSTKIKMCFIKELELVNV